MRKCLEFRRVLFISSIASTNNAIVDLTRTFDFILLHLPLVGTSPRILPQSRSCFKSKHRPSLPEFLCALTIAWSGRAKARVYGDAAAGSHYQPFNCPAPAKTRLERGTPCLSLGPRARTTPPKQVTLGLGTLGVTRTCFNNSIQSGF